MASSSFRAKTIYSAVLLLFLLVACFIVCGKCTDMVPERPKLSESFSAEYTRAGLGTELKGSIYRRFEEGKQFQVEQLGAQHKYSDGEVRTLTRADLKARYKYYEPFGFCSRTSGPDITVNPAWTWIEKAKYLGQKKFNKINVNVWSYNDTENNVYNEIGVSTNNANQPVFIFDESSKSFGVTVFKTFTNSAPPSTRFDIPQMECIEE